MAKEPNWHKHVAIGTYVLVALTVILIALAILTFVHPPDPAHPMSFDFLSKSIVLPPWLAALIVVLVVVITILIVQRRQIPSPGSSTSEVHNPLIDYRSENESLKRRLDVALGQAAHFANPKAVPQKPTAAKQPEVQTPFAWNSGSKMLTLAWAAGIAMEITWTERPDVPGGLLACVVNQTAYDFIFYKVEITEANSWSQTHKTFLSNRSFEPRQLPSGRDLQPMCKSADQWLARVVPVNNQRYIVLGNGQEPRLLWPTAEPTDTEIWRLTIVPAIETITQVGVVTPLEKKHILLRWTRATSAIDLLEMLNP